MFPSLYARDILRPEIALALESLTRPQHPVIEETLHEVFPSYSTFLRKDRSQELDDIFRVILNVNQFRPGEVKVKLVGDELIVHAKHELKMDQHGYVSREFKRKFTVPEDVERDYIKCVYSKNGLLTIKAPRKIISEEDSEGGMVIPIQVQKSIEMDVDSAERPAGDEVVKAKSSTGTEYVITHSPLPPN